MTPNNQTNLCDMLAHPGAPQDYQRKETNQSLALLLPKLGEGREGTSLFE